MKPFELISVDSTSYARYGKMNFSNENGVFSIPTPMFMPVGTRGSVKAIWQDQLEEIGYRLILGNTYHLYLRPGTSIEQLGGLKKFISWSGAILTDSGGFQVYSLSRIRKFHEDGVMFQSYFDGSKHFLSPESVIDFQFLLDSDIMMVLDDCPPANSDKKRIRESLDRTHRWAKRSKEHFERKKKETDSNSNWKKKQLFGIVQGGIFEDTRLESLEFIESLQFDGIAVGGLSVGEEKEDFYRILSFLGPKLNPQKVHYLMGVGSIKDILYAVYYGFDIFDCVLPTRNARHGHAYTWSGKLNIKNSHFKLDTKPIDEKCDCRVCRRYSRAYIRHLYNTKELLAYELLTYHNLYFYFHFFEKMREAIMKKTFKEFFENFINLNW
ncbi:MAG: tRNA guanosine(34) transglycosylase Tgt [Leptospiraceae bacterium]|nr:tRNA guanosine(34) transglycosylase Tgt [Leptospiraceae bacterium]